MYVEIGEAVEHTKGSNRAVSMVGMGHSSGDGCSVLMVHGRWTEVA